MKHIYFVGLGAIGMKYAARIFDHFPQSINVIASKSQIINFKNNPPNVNGKKYIFKYLTPDTSAPFADLIFIAVKAAQLPQALLDIASFVGEETQIISLMNGISSEEEIADKFGSDKVVYANVYMDAVRDGHNVTYQDIGKINFGKAFNNPILPEVAKIKELFDTCQIPSEIPENMLHAHWFKFAMNVGVNQASAILNATYGDFTTNKYARKLLIDAASEVVKISQACGVNLNRDDIDKILEILASVNPEGKTSMHQDVEARRPTEVDIFAKTVINLGQKYNIPTPVNEVIYTIIKAIDYQNSKN